MKNRRKKKKNHSWNSSINLFFFFFPTMLLRRQLLRRQEYSSLSMPRERVEVLQWKAHAGDSRRARDKSWHRIDTDSGQKQPHVRRSLFSQRVVLPTSVDYRKEQRQRNWSVLNSSPFGAANQNGRRLFHSSSAPMKPDYYSLLGIERSASQDDIKKAFRKKARKLHPDVNKDDPDAAKKFAQVSSAYEVLGDKEKRQMYDQYGEAAFEGGGGPQDWQGVDPEDILRHFGFGFGGRGGGGGGDAQGFGGFGNLGDLFGQGGGGGGEGGPAAKQRGEHIQVGLSLSFGESVHGVERDIAYSVRAECNTCTGSGMKPGTSRKSCSTCGGSGQQVTSRGFFQMMTPCPSCHGAGSTVETPCQSCRGQGTEKKNKRITVSVPGGSTHGQHLRLERQGHAGANGGPPGHLFVTLNVAEDDVFKRDGNDIHVEVPITISQAILGGELDMPTIHGEHRVKVPPGTQPGDTQILRDEGVRPKRRGRNGHQYVHYCVEIPRTLSARQRELIEEFAHEEAQPRSSWLGRVTHFLKDKFNK
jgi:molecular chaperone DnaJ